MTGAASPDGRLSPRPAAELVGRYPVLTPPVTTAGAAVTIVVRDGSVEPEVLLIERATNPDDPASGDVALPGGRVDERDGSLATTALRELSEEVGLGAADLSGPLRFVGAVPAPRFGLQVGVFTAELDRTAPTPAIGSPTEVAHIFWLPQTSLATSRQITRESPRGTRDFLASVHDGHVVWGFTRRVLRQYFEMDPDDGGPAPARTVAP